MTRKSHLAVASLDERPGPAPESSGNKLLDKVRKTLTEADPGVWQIGGEELRPEMRYLRPREFYEQVLVMPLGDASLVLRSQQRVSSAYLPGGYALTPLGPASFTIEVRDKIYNADRIVDPKYADNQKGKRCDVVAKGEIARELFSQVLETVRNYQRSQQKNFTEQVGRLTEELSRRIDETPIDQWEKTEAERLTQYALEIEGVRVELGRYVDADGAAAYRLVFAQNKMAVVHQSEALAQRLFQQLEELGQNAQLIALSSVLEKAGL